MVLPAARFWPLALRAWLVVIFKSPLLARVPSDLMPAPRTLAELLLRLLADRVVLPWAAIKPVLVIAPVEASDKSACA